MPLCKDPLVSLLNGFGFNASRIPRRDYLPGSILARKRGQAVIFFGPLVKAFELPGATSLPMTEVARADHFEGAATAGYRLGLAAKLLSPWLPLQSPITAMGFSRAKRISFRIGRIKVLTAAIADILQFMAQSEPSPALMGLNDCSLFIISEVMQIKELSLVGGSEVESSALLGGQEMPGIKAEVGGTGEGLIRLILNDYHTIGFKAHEIEINNGEYKLAAGRKPGGLNHMARLDDEYNPIIFEGEPWL